MPATSLPRNVIYYDDGSIFLGEAGSLPYTDVILAFLAPADPVAGDYTLRGQGGAFDSSGNPSATGIQALQNAGQNVLISLGGQIRSALRPGQAGWTSAAWQYYAQNQDSLVQQVVTYVKANGLSGVDVDYEDDNGFTGAYDGVDFLVGLTSALVSELPIGQYIITHAPQTPYWDRNYYNAPYKQIWERAGDFEYGITWINNQFYNNPRYDATPELKVQWFNTIATLTGPEKLMLGAPLSDATEGYLSPGQLNNQVIQQLRGKWNSTSPPSCFGGVMGWQFSLDNDGTWAQTIWNALTS
jgi:chitinase